MRKVFLMMGLLSSIDVYAENLYKSNENLFKERIALRSLKSNLGKEYIANNVQNILSNQADYKLTFNLVKNQTYRFSYVCMSGTNIENLAKCGLNKKSVKFGNEFLYSRSGRAKLTNYNISDREISFDIIPKHTGYVELIMKSVNNPNLQVSNAFFIENH